MKKLILKTICAAFLCFTLVMLYMHRNLIIAAIKGEALPKAPKGCLAYHE